MSGKKLIKIHFCLTYAILLPNFFGIIIQSEQQNSSIIEIRWNIQKYRNKTNQLVAQASRPCASNRYLIYNIKKRIQSSSLMWSLNMVYHFFKMILSQCVPVCAAINFLRSPIVSSGLHLTRTFFPRRSLHVISIILQRYFEICKFVRKIRRSIRYKTPNI